MKAKKWVAGVLALALALSLTSCKGSGKEQGTENKGAGGTKDFVWVPEFMAADSEEGNLFADAYNVQVQGDYLYFGKSLWDSETGKNSFSIVSFSMKDGKAGEEILLPKVVYDPETGESRNVQGFFVKESGELLTLEIVYRYNRNTDESSMQYFLCKYDRTGETLSENELTEYIIKDGENVYIQHMAVDGSGRSYLCCENTVHLLDADGKYSGKIVLNGEDAWIYGIGAGKDGNMYVSMYERSATGSGMCLKKLDFEKKSADETYSNLPSGNSNGMLITGIEKDFLVNDGQALYEYDLASQSYEKLLDWLDSDINGNNIAFFYAMEDGRILTIVNDWDTGSTELAWLTKKKASEVPAKTQIVIGALYSASEIQAAAVNFNKKSDQWHVGIKTYYDYNSVTGDNYQQAMQDALMHLNNDITSNNCPDLLLLNGLNMQRLGAKGVFEDLNPYLEKSSKVRRQDYFENLLDAYTCGDALVAIPKSFSLNTVAGKASDLGDEGGWTMQEMLAYADKHPKAQLFDGGTKEYILRLMMTYNQGNYIDWANNKSSFDSDDFIHLLEFANRFDEEYQWREDEPSTPQKIATGDVLLYQSYIYGFDNIQMVRGIFGDEDVNFIGYPNESGDGGTYFESSEGIAITSKSANKDGAWAFLEEYLNTENERYSWGLSSKKTAFEEAKKKATQVRYLTDENGNQVVDDDGKPIEIGGGGAVSFGDGWTYKYHRTTVEEAEILEKLIKSAKPSNSFDEEILKIITEEAEAYFKGAKSAPDVAGVIQSRVKVYLSENN